MAEQIMKKQLDVPENTSLYAGMISFIHETLPKISLLIAKRVAIRFFTSFKNDKRKETFFTLELIGDLVNYNVVCIFKIHMTHHYCFLFSSMNEFMKMF